MLHRSNCLNSIANISFKRPEKRVKNKSLQMVLISFATLAVAGMSSISEAARVSKIKGTQVLIDNEDPSIELNDGDKYYVVVDGKKKAIVQVVKTKGRKAIAKIIKGTPTVNGEIISPKGQSREGANGAQAASDQGSKSSNKNSLFNQLSMGVMAGLSMDTQSVQATDSVTSTTESISMTGIGYSFKIFADVPVSGNWGLGARLGGEQFSVSGTSTAGTVKTSIVYGTGDLLLRYAFSKGHLVPFAHIGLGLHLPMSKTSDTLDVQKISTTTVFFAGGGLNYDLNKKYYFTSLIEYGMFPPSTDVTTSLIAVRLGVGYRF